MSDLGKDSSFGFSQSKSGLGGDNYLGGTNTLGTDTLGGGGGGDLTDGYLDGTGVKSSVGGNTLGAQSDSDSDDLQGGGG